MRAAPGRNSRKSPSCFAASSPDMKLTPVRPALSPAGVEFDRDVLALDKACFLQALAERSHEVRHVSERPAVEKPHHRHCWLLRARRERPRGCCAAEPCISRARG
jgi:hypothetical protein